MEIVTLLGSPRIKGNTATVLGAFEERLAPDHRVERFNLAKRKIHGCVGCDTCQRNLDAPGCKQKDDALLIFQRMMQADLIVYASPLYCWDFTAQMKPLLDRHYCLTKWRGDAVVKSFLEGKRVMLLVTCGSGIENNADFIQGIFERSMAAAHCEIVGKYILPHCTIPKELGDRPAAMADEMVKDLLAVTV